MRKKVLCLLLAGISLFALAGCARSVETPKVGVSFGVGGAARWSSEGTFMEERARELGIEIEVRLNTTEEPTQEQDCREMIDSGIDVLIFTPRSAEKAEDILAYAKKKGVAVVNYSRVILGGSAEFFVGHDGNRMGQIMGQFLSELVYEGDYILLHGDEGDNNARLLYEGAMRYIDPIRGSIRILLDAPVPNWSPEKAGELVREAVMANGNRVDAILAPNDKIAGACAAVLAELGVTEPVVITGMDAELDAAKRIVAGTQSMTVYMDLRELAYTAVEQAYNIATGKDVDVNNQFDDENGGTIPSNLVIGQIVTKENIDKILIDSGYFTREEVYGG